MRIGYVREMGRAANESSGRSWAGEAAARFGAEGTSPAKTERKMAAETLLSSLLGLLLLGLLFPAPLTGGVGSLNLEELSEMRYGIQILPLPVMGGQVRGAWGRGSCAKRKGARTVKEEGQLRARRRRWKGDGEEEVVFSQDRRESRADPRPWGPGTGRGGASRRGRPSRVTGKAARAARWGSESALNPPPPLPARSWRARGFILSSDWALPQGLKRDLVVLDPSLCLPAPLPDPSFPEPSFGRGGGVVQVQAAL